MKNRLWIAAGLVLLLGLGYFLFTVQQHSKQMWSSSSGLSLVGRARDGGNDKSEDSKGLDSVFSSDPAVEFMRLDALRAEMLPLLEEPERYSERIAEIGERFDAAMSRLSPEQFMQYYMSRHPDRGVDFSRLQEMSPEELNAKLDQVIDLGEQKGNDPLAQLELAKIRADQIEMEKVQSLGTSAEQAAKYKQGINSSNARTRAMNDEIQRLVSKRKQDRGIPIPTD